MKALFAILEHGNRSKLELGYNFYHSIVNLAGKELIFSFLSRHLVARVTLSPARILVPEDAGAVIIQLIRSGDISLRSRVFFNTCHTSRDAAMISKNIWYVTNQEIVTLCFISSL